MGQLEEDFFNQSRQLWDTHKFIGILWLLLFLCRNTRPNLLRVCVWKHVCKYIDMPKSINQ